MNITKEELKEFARREQFSHISQLCVEKAHQIISRPDARITVPILMKKIDNGEHSPDEEMPTRLAQLYIEKYNTRQFDNYIDQARALGAVAKEHKLKYGFEVGPRRVPEYYKACHQAAVNCDLDNMTIDKQSKQIAHQKRNLSEAMGSFLKLGKYGTYFKERYAPVVKKIEKDRCMLEHRSNILKMKKKINKDNIGKKKVVLKCPKGMKDIIIC
jgi:hypothetical protein